MKNVNFYLHERKFVEWDVRATDPAQVIMITAATWRLTRTDGTEESIGTCSVVGNRVGALIEPKQLGTYILSITVDIPPEIFIEEVQVRVIPNNAS